MSISVSEQVAALHDDFTRLLFTWMIAHADDWGVLTGSAAKIKALVVPMLDHTSAEIEVSLADMDAHELIWRYTGPDGRPWLQFRTWEEHQSGLHKRTAAKSPRYADVSGNSPEPMGYRKELPGTSGNVREIPSEQKRTEENLNRREESKPKDTGKEDEEGANAPASVAAVSPPVSHILCGQIAKAAHLTASVDSLQRLITRHQRHFTPDELISEADKAAEWIAEHPKRQMNLRFLDNWLKRAATPLPQQQQNGAKPHGTTSHHPTGANSSADSAEPPAISEWEARSLRRIEAAAAARAASLALNGSAPPALAPGSAS